MQVFKFKPHPFSDGQERKSYVEKIFADVEKYSEANHIDDYEIHFHYVGYDIHADGHVIPHIEKWTKSQVHQFLQGLGD